ncbi:hypothetical protein A4G18_09170 [Pasteurellaceae bacterium Pebbles2]|nr:hypothetical protein [Pasteurellaceae bacterium Pebbles2]
MKPIYILLGFLCVALGLVGAVLPLLPTTPFLLCALYCFAKGSPKLHQWFMQTQLYQKHLKSFDEQRALSMKAKISILTLSTTMLLIGFYFTPVIYAKVLIILLLIVKYWFFFFWIKTVEN